MNARGRFRAAPGALLAVVVAGACGGMAYEDGDDGAAGSASAGSSGRGGTSNTSGSACRSRLPRERSLIADVPQQLLEDLIERGVRLPCIQDIQCNAAAYGHCEIDTTRGTRCDYGCTQSSECGSGSTCICGDVIGSCTQRIR
jgi:hypothetical protein